MRIRSGEKVMTTELKNIESPADLPVFTFCSKNQYRKADRRFLLVELIS